MEEDVNAATAKAQKASFHRRGQHHQTAGGGGQDGEDAAAMVDFVGFLEFIHTLDIEVRGATHRTNWVLWVGVFGKETERVGGGVGGR